jgi:hypothetical protein
MLYIIENLEDVPSDKAVDDIKRRLKKESPLKTIEEKDQD